MNTRNSYRRSRKFEPGEPITSTNMLLWAAKQGRWIFFGTHPAGRRSLGFRAYHASWILNMNFSCVCSYIEGGMLRLANRNREYPYVFKAEFMESMTPDVQSEWWATCSEIPAAKIRAFTREALVRDCEQACRVHGLETFRFRVQFITPLETREAVKLITA